VRQIVQLAGIGEPTAKKALTALKVAKQIKAKVHKAAPIKPKPRLPLAPRAQSQKALTATAQPSPAPALMPATSTTSSLRRWLDVFAPWRRGVG
jgi:hypothetical protein